MSVTLVLVFSVGIRLTSTVGGHLVLFKEQRTWLESKSRCEQLGGHLAVLELTGNQTDLKAGLRIGSTEEAWVGNVKTFETIDTTAELPSDKQLQDQTEYQCGFVKFSEVLQSGLSAVTYTYDILFNPCGNQLDYICRCHRQTGEVLATKAASASWRGADRFCKLNANTLKQCVLWNPDIVHEYSGSINVTDTLRQKTLQTNHPYWIGRVLRLHTADGLLANQNDLAECGFLGAYNDGVDFQSCSRRHSFVCDIGSHARLTTTDATELLSSVTDIHEDKGQTTFVYAVDENLSDRQKGTCSGRAVYISVTVVGLALVILCVVLLIIWKKKKQNRSSDPNTDTAVVFRDNNKLDVDCTSVDAEENRMTRYARITFNAGYLQDMDESSAMTTKDNLCEDGMYAVVRTANIHPDNYIHPHSETVGSDDVTYDVTASLKRMNNDDIRSGTIRPYKDDYDHVTINARGGVNKIRAQPEQKADEYVDNIYETMSPKGNY